MELENLLNELNPTQREAVECIEGPLLILAGAGSGKTKTLITRLIYLIDYIGIPANNTLTITFTNKAASEMRERALRGLQSSSNVPLLCTFHKFGLLFLRKYIKYLKRETNFVIFDRDDQKRLIKELLQESEENEPINLILSEISRYKNSKITPKQAQQTAVMKRYEVIARIYERYQEFLERNNRVDFDDLLLLPLEILENNLPLAKDVSLQYQYIMVDEYQDTNEVQYLLLKQLCSAHDNLCVVGDEDQSIYSWRGANIANILNFAKRFPNAKVIKLELNYRSTPQILKAANLLIGHNSERIGKVLQSTQEDGKEIELIACSNEREEAYLIALRIKELLQNGIEARNIAVLFRLNALSRALEDALNRNRIPFRLVGTIRFYERAEVKDTICYFRLLVDLRDNFSLWRVINVPRRGIGRTTLERLNLLSHRYEYSVFELFSKALLERLPHQKTALLREHLASENYQAIKQYLEQLSPNGLPSVELSDNIGKKAFEVICEFFITLLELQQILRNEANNFVELFEKAIGLCLSLSKKLNEEEINRVANIEEFYGLFRVFIAENPFGTLEDFLNDLALREEQEEIKGEGVSCMSVHSSKGLEFDYLFVMGLENGIFPLTREDSDEQEERRLGYVAFTRAKRELTLSYVEKRKYYGDTRDLDPSKFLKEAELLPSTSVEMIDYQEENNLLEYNGAKLQQEEEVIDVEYQINARSIGLDPNDPASQAVLNDPLALQIYLASQEAKKRQFEKGDSVYHKVFGTGVVKDIYKDKKLGVRLQVSFGGTLRILNANALTKT